MGSGASTYKGETEAASSDVKQAIGQSPESSVKHHSSNGSSGSRFHIHEFEGQSWSSALTECLVEAMCPEGVSSKGAPSNRSSKSVAWRTCKTAPSAQRKRSIAVAKLPSIPMKSTQTVPADIHVQATRLSALRVKHETRQRSRPSTSESLASIREAKWSLLPEQSASRPPSFLLEKSAGMHKRRTRTSTVKLSPLEDDFSCRGTRSESVSWETCPTQASSSEENSKTHMAVTEHLLKALRSSRSVPNLAFA